ncbi:hypothetical protein CCAX7_31110 [Capsulimonas corticalis]|uniref:Uncharacterized protein n=1 Tax=Capsulimonas corticalis TaxID=2219043 RepID=A0A402CSJ6_9BACT|nr:hypothetical protein CCAX7_31110 [Capsulimonas corticalis]
MPEVRPTTGIRAMQLLYRGAGGIARMTMAPTPFPPKLHLWEQPIIGRAVDQPYPISPSPRYHMGYGRIVGAEIL